MVSMRLAQIRPPTRVAQVTPFVFFALGTAGPAQALPRALPLGAAGRETNPVGLALGGGAGRNEPPLSGLPRKENPSLA